MNMLVPVVAVAVIAAGWGGGFWADATFHQDVVMFGEDCQLRLDNRVNITGIAYSSYDEGHLLVCRDSISDGWEFRDQYEYCIVTVAADDTRASGSLRCWNNEQE